MANENTEYERLTQEIYQAINSSEGVKNIDVKHNIKLAGKSGCQHQIDVYWEFEMMGEKHRVAIECKNYSKEVSVGRIRDFFGVLHDVGNIKGIFITKKGYQSGAIKFGEHYGISLKELRFPSDKDWEGRVKDIVVKISVFSTDIKQRNIDIDMDWFFENTDYKEGDQIDLSGMADEIKIVDAEGNSITDFHTIESALPHEWKEEVARTHEEKFTDAFLKSPKGEIFKINGISYVYDVNSETQESVTEGEAIAKAILKDVTSGNIKFYDKHGSVRNVRSS
ncbi:restriction endonuclease [Vibrio parahaemolyticus]|uniref:restriction endonuclease n=1 Tax=Vibrio parahaemolyticus TaxID=670 RepID=UPI0029290729|nr:restriction endonuclease [Vibrio parahaemolyticus]